MISNKEGSDIAYAIDIENLKTIWESVPQGLFDNLDPIPSPKPNLNLSSFMKYIALFLLLIALTVGAYKIIPLIVNKYKQDSRFIVISNNPLEAKAFQALLDKKYPEAKNLFEKLDKRYPQTNNYYDIAKVLRQNLNTLHRPLVRKTVIRKIILNYKWNAPKGSIEALKKQLN